MWASPVQWLQLRPYKAKTRQRHRPISVQVACLGHKHHIMPTHDHADNSSLFLRHFQSLVLSYSQHINYILRQRATIPEINTINATECGNIIQFSVLALLVGQQKRPQKEKRSLCRNYILQRLYNCRLKSVCEGLGCGLGWTSALSVTHSADAALRKCWTFYPTGMARPICHPVFCSIKTQNLYPEVAWLEKDTERRNCLLELMMMMIIIIFWHAAWDRQKWRATVSTRNTPTSTSMKNNKTKKWYRFIRGFFENGL